MGVSKEAEYTQASFFFDQNGQASFGVKQSEKTRHNEFMRQYEEDRKTALAGKYNYLNPKKGGPHGAMCNGFIEVDGKTYYCRPKAEAGYPEGSMVTGERMINGKNYTFETDGKMRE